MSQKIQSNSTGRLAAATETGTNIDEDEKSQKQKLLKKNTGQRHDPKAFYKEAQK